MVSEYFNSGRVKAILAKLFKEDLGFIKSANLAGEMLKKHWKHSIGDNKNQKALCILADAASMLNSFAFYDPNVGAVYLWCHQKATGKRGLFFSIGSTKSDKSAASNWLMNKAAAFATQTGETQYFRKLRPNSAESFLKKCRGENVPSEKWTVSPLKLAQSYRGRQFAELILYHVKKRITLTKQKGCNGHYLIFAKTASRSKRRMD